MLEDPARDADFVGVQRSLRARLATHRQSSRVGQQHECARPEDLADVTTGDESRNNWLLAVFTMGEGWHNNHHAYQSSVRQGFKWWEFDPTYYLLRALSWTGLVWDLKTPPEPVLRNEQRLGAKVINRAAEEFKGGRMSDSSRSQRSSSGMIATNFKCRFVSMAFIASGTRSPMTTTSDQKTEVNGPPRKSEAAARPRAPPGCPPGCGDTGRRRQDAKLESQP